MRKTIIAVAASAAIGTAALAVPIAASATTTHATHGTRCNADWYQNADETSLKPKQLRSGMLFDGPSLIHHAPGAAYTLASVPTDGAFSARLFTGVLPLFKLETTNPYSTVNKTSGGYWSSKIATGPGSQGDPVASPADLVGKGTYTDSTTILSFGVGYANDTGNKALVRSVTFGAHRYSLGCRPDHPKPTPTPSDSGSASPSPSSSPTSEPSTPPGEAPAPTPVPGNLGVTG